MSNYSKFILALPLLLCSCSDDDIDPASGFPAEVLSPVVSMQANLSLDLTQNKASYSPGEAVSFTLTGTAPSGLRVRYRQGNTIIADESVSGASWTWTTPATDYTGYMAELYTADSSSSETIYGTTAVDVSSNWAKFPRYGFLSDYDAGKTGSVISDEVNILNRYHINGIQFYDWQYKHHWPLGGTRGNLLSEYTEIANRTVVTSVLQNYISTLHNHGIKAMFYDLCYGALDDAASDGVDSHWYMFDNTSHSSIKKLDMADSWKSDIYLMDPSNTGWQNYMVERVNDVYASLDFDGYHTDQVGDQGTVYDYYGSQLNLPSGFASYLKAMRKANPDKYLVMNSVSGYGAKKIASGGSTDFLYNEIWSFNEPNFSDIRNIIKSNNTYSSNTKSTVIAGYMDYRLKKEYFNTPGVLLTDAVIFALGGNHIELSGDHMLNSEYFPDSYMKMDDKLKAAIVHYYDFMTAYENLLRDGGTETTAEIYSGNSSVNISAWPPALSNVVTYSKAFDDKQVVHLLNFRDANSLAWGDANGDMPEPAEVTNLTIRIKANGVSKVWAASPDRLAGASQELNFISADGYVTLTVPSLKYWTMLVLEK